MKVSLEWLSDYVEVVLPAKELAHRLTMSGTEVGGINPRGPVSGSGAASFEDMTLIFGGELLLGLCVACRSGQASWGDDAQS